MINRRKFLTTSSIAAASLAAPGLLTRAFAAGEALKLGVPVPISGAFAANGKFATIGSLMAAEDAQLHPRRLVAACGVGDGQDEAETGQVVGCQVVGTDHQFGLRFAGGAHGEPGEGAEVLELQLGAAVRRPCPRGVQVVVKAAGFFLLDCSFL